MQTGQQLLQQLNLFETALVCIDYQSIVPFEQHVVTKAKTWGVGDNSSMNTILYRIRKGFTLAELLVALAVLSVIATFTIPKILTSTNQAKLNVILKEDIAVLQQVFYESCAVNNLRGATNTNNSFLNKISVAKLCITSALDEGCWIAPMSSTLGQNSPGFIMHNGSHVFLGTSLGNGPSLYGYIIIDANGPASPNIVGEDTIILISLFSDPISNISWISAPLYRSCQLIPYGGSSITLWNKLFTK